MSINIVLILVILGNKKPQDIMRTSVDSIQQSVQDTKKDTDRDNSSQVGQLGL